MTIQALPRPDYIKKPYPQHIETFEGWQNEFTPSKWDRISELYRKATYLVEVDRADNGDEIMERLFTQAATNAGFELKTFIVKRDGKWVRREEFRFRGKKIENLKLWEIELLFTEL